MTYQATLVFIHSLFISSVLFLPLLSAYLETSHITFQIQVLEEIRVGLELNDYGMQQRRIAHMRFLGELYNYEHVDSSVIFDTLYLILVFGHGTAEVYIQI